MSTKWERLELFLFDHDKDGTDFSVREYAEAANIEADVASAHIQDHLRAQRREGSKTLFVLRRVPGTRTTNARWAVGARTKDARHLGMALHDDVLRKVMRAFVPDLRRIAELNPRAARATEAQIESVVSGAMKVLEAAAIGAPPNDH